MESLFRPIAVRHRGNVVVYINLDLCDFTLDEISQKLAGFIRDSLLIAGYGESDAGALLIFRGSMYRLLFPFRQAPAKLDTSWIHDFNDALPYILEQIRKS